MNNEKTIIEWDDLKTHCPTFLQSDGFFVAQNSTSDVVLVFYNKEAGISLACNVGDILDAIKSGMTASEVEAALVKKEGE